MRLDTDDTIAAVASAPGHAARGIVRVSGPRAVSCVSGCFRAEVGLDMLRKSTVVDGRLMLDPPLREIPCQALVWPNQRSYTRQPSVELHLWGSPPLLEAALEKVCGQGARLAEPGEFTLRAFLAGRLDLTQAEAVLGVIQATTPSQLNVSLWQLSGGLAGPLHELRDQLLDLLAHLEAGLDFVEEDIEFITHEELQRQLRQVAAGVERIQSQIAQRHDHNERPRVVLRGLPNAGKSSLLNVLAGRQSAIVSPVAGTTRDYVNCELEFGGIACQLIDTAGLESASPESTSDELTSEPRAAAQRQTEQQNEAAHLELFCLDAAQPLDERTARELATVSKNRLVVITKSDLQRGPLSVAGIVTSSLTGEGIDQLRREIADRLRSDDESQVVAGTAARCVDSLRLAAESLNRALQTHHLQLGEELVAAELRIALQEIGRVVGTVYTDDVLDRIFSRFCIGK